jgi:hypothetical protein
MADDQIRDLQQERRTRRLLAIAEGGLKRTKLAAETLTVDIDGTEVAQLIPDIEAFAIELPEDALIVTLRDELGTPRATFLPQDETLVDQGFDQDRLVLSTTETSAGAFTVSIRATQMAVPLAAAPAQRSGRDDSIVPIRFTDDGSPQVDEDGFFVMEAYCDMQFANKPVVIEVRGLPDSLDTISPEGFVRVVCEAPDLGEQTLAESSVVVRLR